MKHTISAAILSGGMAKRFGGSPKQELVFGGKSIMTWMLESLSGLFGEIIVVTNNHSLNNLYNLKTVPDIFPGIGPLGGIHAALSISSSDAVFIVAGDMPLIDRNLIKQQIGIYAKRRPDVLIPRIGEYIEPLHSVYSRKILSSLEQYILDKKRNAVWEFLKTVNTGYFEPVNSDEAARSFISVNTPEDAAIVEKIILSSHGL